MLRYHRPDTKPLPTAPTVNGEEAVSSPHDYLRTMQRFAKRAQSDAARVGTPPGVLHSMQAQGWEVFVYCLKPSTSRYTRHWDITTAHRQNLAHHQYRYSLPMPLRASTFPS